MTRRDFIQHSATLAAATTLLQQQACGNSPTVKNIGIQLFSVPKLLEKDFEGTINMLSNMGYSEIETYGPYPFSPEVSKAWWNQVVKQVGFSGSGFFGHTAEEVRDILKKYDMRVASAHADYDTLQQSMAGLGEAAEVLGYEYVCLPSVPPDKRKTLDDYKRTADEFNKIGEDAKKHNLKFAYHNHGYGFKEVEGVIPVNMLIESTDPGLVFLEMDLFWTLAGGVDPVAYLEKYKGRYKLMHVKDMKEKKTFSGDGGDPSQWIELFPYMTSAGSGVVDLKTILPKAKSTGVEHFFVEQDIVADPDVALKKSADYLKTL